MSAFRVLVVGFVSSLATWLGGCGSTYPGGFGDDWPGFTAGSGAAGSGAGTFSSVAGVGAVPAGRGGAGAGTVASAGSGWGGWGGVAGAWGVAGSWGGIAGTGPTAAVGGTGWIDPGYIDRDRDGVESWRDCNDLDPSVYPGAIDVCCDQLDNDCDGQDGAVGEWCRCEGAGPYDRDGDGVPVEAGDCNDLDARFSPKSMDACCDGLDFDCDGRDDPRNVLCECGVSFDNDGDGYTRDYDCNDFDARTYPGALEICSDGRDNDCNGLYDATDPYCSRWRDADGDGWSFDIDCDDSQPWINPGAIDVCGDNVDNNCDGLIDPYPDCTTEQFDWDRDGYPWGSDCDDGNATVFPGSPFEQCCDGIDSNCDGVDYPYGVMCVCGGAPGDADGDGYTVGFAPPGQADCNDQDWSVNPGVPEICFDDRDNDCDGLVDMNDTYCELILN